MSVRRGPLYLRSEKGVTLIELIAAVLVTGILMGILTLVFQKLTTVLRQNSLKSSMQIEAQTATDLMTHFISRGQAYSLVITQKSGSPAYSQFDFVVNDSSSTKYSYFLEAIPTDPSAYNLVMETQVGTGPIARKVLSSRAVEFGVSCTQGCAQNPSLLDLKLTLQKKVDALHVVTIPVKRSGITMLAN